MRSNFIGGKRLVAVGVMSSLGKSPSSPGDAGFAVYDNAVRVDQPAFEGGSQRQPNTGGITPRVSDDLRCFQSFPVKFRDTVRGNFMQLRLIVVKPVPFVVIRFVVKAEISAQVDEQSAFPHAFFCERLAQAVGEGSKDNVAFFNDVVFIR